MKLSLTTTAPRAAPNFSDEEQTHLSALRQIHQDILASEHDGIIFYYAEDLYYEPDDMVKDGRLT
jgi:hypothetical protein